MTEKKRPVIVCLCGSTRFMREFYDANMRETLAGKIVLTVGMSSQGDCRPTDEQKVMLDELHKRKIDLADEVLILNCPVPYCEECQEFRTGELGCSRAHPFRGVMKPYIGNSTRSELEYATKHGKTVRFLENPTE